MTAARYREAGPQGRDRAEDFVKVEDEKECDSEAAALEETGGATGASVVRRCGLQTPENRTAAFWRVFLRRLVLLAGLRLWLRAARPRQRRWR